MLHKEQNQALMATRAVNDRATEDRQRDILKGAYSNNSLISSAHRGFNSNIYTTSYPVDVITGNAHIKHNPQITLKKYSK